MLWKEMLKELSMKGLRYKVRTAGEREDEKLKWNWIEKFKN